MKSRFSRYLRTINDKNTLATIIHYATTFAIAIFIPYYLFTGISYMYIVDTVIVIALLLASIAYHKKNYIIGKFMTLSLTTTYLFILSYLLIDYKTNTNLFFFLLIIVSLTITNYHNLIERYLAIIFSLINLILVFVSELIDIKPLFDLPEDTIHILSIANTAVFGLLLAIIFYYYNYSIHIYQRDLHKFATTDPLTGILNRREFFAQAKTVFNHAVNNNSDFSIILLDIDYFKSINDQHGHPIGDRVLLALSQLIQHEIKSTDLFARYGGEEFVIINKHLSDSSSFALAETLRQTIKSHDFHINNDLTINLTVSIGVCQFQKSNHLLCSDIDSMLQAADKALYHAKNQGRNQCSLA